MNNLLFLTLLIALLVPNFTLAQQTKPAKEPTKEKTAAETSATNVATPANDQTTSPPKTKRVSKKKTTPVKEAVIEMPSLGDRLNDQRLAIRRGEPREPSQPYLIEEVSVNGIYKSVEGHGAFLKAVNGRLFFAYKGMLFYDGEVLQIDPDQVIFQQILPNGKTKQIIKAYDPSALRSSAIEKDKDKDPKKKKTKKDDDGDSEDAGTKDE